MDIEIEIKNRFRLPRGVSEETVRKGLLWIEQVKRTRVSKEFPDGWITNDEIVAEGMRQGSDVWPLFEHDDATIRKYYHHAQANYLAGCYVATVVHDNGSTTIHKPANVIVRPLGADRYFASPVSLVREDDRKQVIAECVQLLKAAQNRLAKIQGSFRFSVTFIEAINHLIAKMENAAKAKTGTKKKQPARNQPTA